MKIAWLLHQVRRDPWDLSSAVSCTRKMKEMKLVTGPPEDSSAHGILLQTQNIIHGEFLFRSSILEPHERTIGLCQQSFL
ncbi:hypothetical protein PVAP13_7NG100085 [Panicum virgatum]|uniref:Uncharacterized protein n=1 Tax=Panicum virgatum TaxID=38727 RepID=A0A8T0Q3F9_PANVG|nr:hypothetical protein PVAP13_7NG100085 [Panicum virgatum]